MIAFWEIDIPEPACTAELTESRLPIIAASLNEHVAPKTLPDRTESIEPMVTFFPIHEDPSTKVSDVTCAFPSTEIFPITLRDDMNVASPRPLRVSKTLKDEPRTSGPPALKLALTTALLTLILPFTFKSLPP
jgi:hypothetical protein